VSLEDTAMANGNIDLSKLDFNNIGNWPIILKIIAIIIICAAALGAGFYYDTQEQLKQLEKIRNDEKALRADFEKKQKQANVLDKLKEQLEEIKASFGELLKRLPNQTEVDALLMDIAQQGLASGLTFQRFQPGGETPGPGGFYVELPINLTLSGDYHSLGKFVSGVAALPRIVTQHNIKLQPAGAGILTMTQVAKTYRYIDEEKR
jgi:type IV pilus assembly protein PilO